MREDGVMRLRSTSSVPRAVAQSLPTEAGERVLAGARDQEGLWHVGSDAAFYLASGDGHRRLPWETIERATWDRDSNRLSVVETADFAEPQPVHALHIEDPGRLLELARERITASVLLTHPVPVGQQGGRGSVTVVARRSPTRSGEISFSFVLDRGLGPVDPDVRAAADLGLAHARDELGL